MKWSWNDSDCGDWEHGTFDTREEAIRDAYEHEEQLKRQCSCVDDVVIYIGQCEMIPLRTDLDADRELEYLDERYCDDSGCDYYIYDGVSVEDKKWLEQELSTVMKRFHERIGLTPCWFRMVNIDSFVMR